MITAPTLWAFLIGAILGMVIVGLLLKVRLTQKAAEAVQTCKSELAVLEERIRAKELSYDNLLIKNQEMEKELDQLRDTLIQEGQEKVAALKELEQLPEVKNSLQGREEENLGLREEISRLKQVQAELETTLHQERLAVEEKLSLLDEASQKMSDAFKALSSEALRSNNQQFLDLARATLEKFQTEAQGDLAQRQKAVETLVAPLKDTLDRYAQQVQSMEQARQQAYGSLSQHLKQMAVTEEKLQQETGNLVKALRSPQVRGRWGEITLRRVAELAGMSEHCDFMEQETVPGETGRLRPDMVVRMPNRKMVVVDSKAPLQSYPGFPGSPDGRRPESEAPGPRPAGPDPPAKIIGQGLLGPVQRGPGVRGLVSAGGKFFQRRPGAESPADRRRGEPAGHPGYPHDLDCPAAGHCLWLAPGATGGKRPGHQRPGKAAL